MELFSLNNERRERRAMVQHKGRAVPELKPIYEADEHGDFRALLKYAAENYSGDIAFIIKEGKDADGKALYSNITYRGFERDVKEFGTGMIVRGLANKRVAIIGKNSYPWYMTHFALMCGLGISVPLDKGLPYEELENSLIKSKADCLIFDNEHKELAERLIAAGSTEVNIYISMEDEEGFESLSEIMTEGSDAIETGDMCFDEMESDPNAVQVLLFTSGTTSKAKAVMLSQRNILSDIYMLDRIADIKRGDINMAILPFHHTFGSTGQTMMISLGVTTVFCDGLKYVQRNMQEYGVTVFICVPLLIEAMYAKIQAGIDKKGMRRKFETGLRISSLLRKFNIDIRRKLFKDIIDELGGGLRNVVSGASALSTETLKGFEDIGIDVVQGYGMTEASPVIAAESPGTKRPGSIGHSMPGVEVRVVDQNEEGIGELICRGPNIMLGYYEDEEATAEVLKGGWLCTGDLARVDKDGFVFLCGRKKNVIVLKNGKNVYPEEIEELIEQFPYVVECMVYGEPRKDDGSQDDIIPAVTIVYDPALLSREGAEKVVQADLDKINEMMPVYKHIHRFRLTDEPMEKTTTGKIKRYAG
ncbi:MAG: AMP-binding protein [Mogibacterium sp.]|nr:AMP-binding protein [Mogibacterium sp.]